MGRNSEISAKFASFHKSLMNHYQTYQPSENEALRNLLFFIKPSKEACIFYHKHEVNFARTLGETFTMLYNRFLSTEVRDRLLDVWDNLNFCRFSTITEAANNSAIRELFETASMLQLQVGSSYQDDQHLTNTLMSAVS